jgi:HEAT repeat protein
MVIVVMLVLVGGFILLSPSVPNYQGKSVYDWMFQQQSSALESNPGLSAIGSNAVPYLARALAMRNTPYDRFAWVRNHRVQTVANKLGLGLRWTRPSKQVRHYATWSLLAFGFESRPALPQLHAELLAPDAADRQMIIACLSELGLPVESIPLLVQAWPLATNNSSNVRHDLLYALGHGGTNAAAVALPIVVASLGDREQSVQHVAVNTLERWALPVPGAVPRLVELLSLTNTMLAGAAAAALGRVTNRADEALPALRKIMAGTNDYARASAASALWRLGGDADEARGMLESLLTTKRGKGTAAGYLGQMGPEAKESVPALLRASHENIGAWVDMSDRARCAKAVLRIQSESAEAIGVLEEALAFKSNGWVRTSVAEDIGKLSVQARPLIPALRRGLQDPDRDVRHAAAEALKQLEAVGIK